VVGNSTDRGKSPRRPFPPCPLRPYWRLVWLRVGLVVVRVGAPPWPFCFLSLVLLSCRCCAPAIQPCRCGSYCCCLEEPRREQEQSRKHLLLWILGRLLVSLRAALQSSETLLLGADPRPWPVRLPPLEPSESLRHFELWVGGSRCLCCCCCCLGPPARSATLHPGRVGAMWKLAGKDRDREGERDARTEG